MSQFYSVGLRGSRDGLARINTKHVTSTYLKSETQSVWARNALRKSKATTNEETPPAQDQRYISFHCSCNLRSKRNRRGSQVIVIHPGSRFIRIGKASDVNPISVPCVVARKHKTPFVAPERVSLVSRPRPETSVDKTLNEDEEHIPPDDPVSFTEDRNLFTHGSILFQV